MSDAGTTGYTVSSGWNWRTAAAVTGAISALLRPMPGWLRVAAARDLLSRTVLRADAEGIAGASGESCRWGSITHIVIWRHGGLRLIGVVRNGDRDRGDIPWGTSVRPRYAKYGRYPQSRRDVPVPRYLEIMAPDGMPLGPENLLTANGRGVRPDRLASAVRSLTASVQVVDLSYHQWVPHSPSEGPVTALREFLEAIHLPWRRLLWTVGVAASAAGIIDDSRKLASGLLAPGQAGGHVFGLVLCCVVLLALLARWRVVLRRRRRARRSGGISSLLDLAEAPPDRHPPAIDRGR